MWGILRDSHPSCLCGATIPTFRSLTFGGTMLWPFASPPLVFSLSTQFTSLHNFLAQVYLCYNLLESKSMYPQVELAIHIWSWSIHKLWVWKPCAFNSKGYKSRKHTYIIFNFFQASKWNFNLSIWSFKLRRKIGTYPMLLHHRFWILLFSHWTI